MAWENTVGTLVFRGKPGRMKGALLPGGEGCLGGGEVPAFRGPGVSHTRLCKAALFFFFNLSRLLTPSSLFFSDDQFIAL